MLVALLAGILLTTMIARFFLVTLFSEIGSNVINGVSAFLFFYLVAIGGWMLHRLGRVEVTE
jgi:hypothetical protein